MADTHTAIAVCGCGQGGRLGLGSDCPDTLAEITLMDDFLPTSSSSSSHLSSGVAGAIVRVGCGAYHTLVLTTAGLYGWGRHEEGQLGLGRPSPEGLRLTARLAGAKDVIYAFYELPTLIPFFDLLNSDSPSTCTSAEREEMVDVHCGADHSLLRTTHALYVTGGNSDGQLGLGHIKSVFQWTRLACVPSPRATVPGDITDLPASTRADGLCTRVLQGRLTHVSCGTHHTLISLADVLVLEHPCIATCTATPRLSHYPALVLSCGRGDFGELGYDPREGCAPPQQQQQTPSVEGRPPRPTTGYAFSWGPAKNAKPRRPPHSDAFFRPVAVRELMEAAQRLPSASATALHAAVVKAEASGGGGAFRLSQAARADVAASLPTPCEEGAAVVAVVTLQAMHHHSAVTLRDTSSSGCGKASLTRRVLHWGCYYCGAAEDAAAATPRPLSDTDEGNGVSWGMHAGEERMFRHALPSPNGGAETRRCVQVMGRGNLGRGEGDDDEATTWADLNAIPSSLAGRDATQPVFVSAIAGRTHFLLTVSAPGTEGGESDCAAVAGFGENLHGQLGTPHAQRAPAAPTAAASDDAEDSVVLPRLVLQQGDTLRTASAVKASLRAANAALSSRPPANAVQGGDGGALVQRWAVAKIRTVGAGARHSVFVLDVRPLSDSGN